MSRRQIALFCLPFAALFVFAAVFVVMPYRWLPSWMPCMGNENGTPSWSPDGRWIAFAASRSCGSLIAEIHPDGSARRNLTTGISSWPSWSPDNRQIIFASPNGYQVVPAAGGTPHVLIPGASDVGAAFSPNGKQIAFTRGLIPRIRGYRSTLFLADSSGAGARQLLGDSCNPGTPSWSPDGRSIAVGCGGGLYIVDLRSGGSHRILRWDYWEGEPPSAAWSPDGRSLVFISDDVNRVEVISPDGSHARGIATLEAAFDSATWSPDGRWIAYSATDYLDSRDGIYIVRPNGTDNHQIARF